MPKNKDKQKFINAIVSTIDCDWACWMDTLEEKLDILLEVQEEKVRKEERGKIAKTIPSSRDMACDCEGDYKCSCCFLQEDQDKFFKNLL